MFPLELFCCQIKYISVYIQHIPWLPSLQSILGLLSPQRIHAIWLPTVCNCLPGACLWCLKMLRWQLNPISAEKRNCQQLHEIWQIQQFHIQMNAKPYNSHNVCSSRRKLTPCQVGGHVRPAVGPYQLPIKIIFFCLSVFTETGVRVFLERAARWKETMENTHITKIPAVCLLFEIKNYSYAYSSV